jgi:hypothetical protein
MGEELIVERIEEGLIAVLELEDLSHINVPLAQLPAGTRAGSVLRRGEDGGYSLCPEREEELRRANFKLASELFGE